jgi:hypothetical protein
MCYMCMREMLASEAMDALVRVSGRGGLRLHPSRRVGDSSVGESPQVHV